MWFPERREVCFLKSENWRLIKKFTWVRKEISSTSLTGRPDWVPGLRHSTKCLPIKSQISEDKFLLLMILLKTGQQVSTDLVVSVLDWGRWPASGSESSLSGYLLADPELPIRGLGSPSWSITLYYSHYSSQTVLQSKLTTSTDRQDWKREQRSSLSCLIWVLASYRKISFEVVL